MYQPVQSFKKCLDIFLFIFSVGLCVEKEVLEGKSNFISAMFQWDVKESQTNAKIVLCILLRFLKVTNSAKKRKIIIIETTK